jgi:hypothetical protein
MSDFRQRFDAAEIGAEAGSIDLIDTARDLEAYADVGWSGPGATFEDRVMAAIGAEPAPRLQTRLGPLATLRQAWRLAWSGGRPLAVRAQALALVLIAAVVLGGAGSLGVIAGSRLLTPEHAPPPTIQPTPSPSPSQSPSPSPSPSRSPSVSPSPTTRTPGPSPTATDQPTGSDDHGGGPGPGGSGGGSGSGSDNSGPGGGGSGSGSGSDSSGKGSDSDK